MISQYSTSVYTLGCMGLQRESLEYMGIVLAIIPLMCGYIIVQVTEKTRVACGVHPDTVVCRSLGTLIEGKEQTTAPQVLYKVILKYFHMLLTCYEVGQNQINTLLQSTIEIYLTLVPDLSLVSIVCGGGDPV